MYQPRTYRHWVKGNDLVPFNVTVKETDLYLRASTDLSHQAQELVSKYRNQLERYIERHPSFLTSFEPVEVTGNAPYMIKDMAE